MIFYLWQFHLSSGDIPLFYYTYVFLYFCGHIFFYNCFKLIFLLVPSYVSILSLFYWQISVLISSHIFQFLYLSGDYRLPDIIKLFWTAGFCCIPLNSVGFCFLIQSQATRISLILSSLAFKICQDRSRIGFRIRLILSPH